MAVPEPLKRILFSSPHSLLDITSGAAISVRTLLACLAGTGVEVRALHANLFDSPAGGAVLLDIFSKRPGDAFLQIENLGLRHIVMRTGSSQRMQMTSGEEEMFIQRFRTEIRTTRPDVVLTFGGLMLERTLVREARSAGIPVLFYLANPNYHGVEPFRDVTAVLTDTQATADLYMSRFGLPCHVVGKFIDAAAFRAPERKPQYITFINPSHEKGAGLFMAIARLAQRVAPHLRFLVVESRGTWPAALHDLKQAAADYSNVTVLGHQRDMRNVYAVSRLVLMPSAWHESGGRVLVEALVNGIPVVASSHGGMGELLGDAGLLVDVPRPYRDQPRQIAPEEAAAPWLAAIGQIIGHDAVYLQWQDKALQRAQRHDLAANARRVIEVIARCRQVESQAVGTAVPASGAPSAPGRNTVVQATG